MKNQVENSDQFHKKHRIRAWITDQFALMPLLVDYSVPEETNNVWYSIGGFLAIALSMQIISGILLSYKYMPDAALAYGIVSEMINSRLWRIILGFHYFNSFLIIILVLAHLIRVFLSAAYRNGKKGLWLAGVALYISILSLYITGESLHWDEVGYAVPWHLSEFFQAINLSNVLHYNFSDLLSPTSASAKLVQLYALHISIIPLLLLLLMALHFYLIRIKGISMPFWRNTSGQKVSFLRHIKVWIIGGSILMISVLLLSIFIGREAGTAPQLLQISPLYEAHKGPGALGFKPSWPIGWTHGTNVFVEKLGLKPDIWGTVIAMVLMLGFLLLIPFIDSVDKEPGTAGDVFDRRRIWAFLAFALFWIIMINGILINVFAGPG